MIKKFIYTVLVFLKRLCTNPIRFILGILFLIALFLTIRWPLESAWSLDDDVIDYRYLINHHIDKGELETAQDILALAQLADTDSKHTEYYEVLSKEISLGLEDRKNWLLETADGFIFGEPHSIAALLGSTASDFLMYGDIRDSFKCAIGQESDGFICACAGIGLITVLAGPVADVGASVLKALKKLGYLGQGLQKHLKHLITAARKGDATSIGKLSDTLSSVKLIIDNSGSLEKTGRLLSVAKTPKDIKHIAFLCKNIKTPHAAKEINAILAVASSKKGLGGERAADKIFEFLKLNPDKIDKLYSTVAKGKKATFALIKFGKTTRKLTKLAKNIKKLMNYLWESFGLKPLWIKYAMVFLFLNLFLLGTLGIRPPRPEKHAQLVRTAYFTIIALSYLATFGSCLYLYFFPTNLITNSLDFKVYSYSPSPREAGIMYELIGYAVVATILALQIAFFFLAKNKLTKSIDKMALRRIEAHCDTPIYLGILGSVLSMFFIGSGSTTLIVAYATTAAGIAIHLAARYIVLLPAKDRLEASEDVIQ